MTDISGDASQERGRDALTGTEIGTLPLKKGRFPACSGVETYDEGLGNCDEVFSPGADSSRSSNSSGRPRLRPDAVSPKGDPEKPPSAISAGVPQEKRIVLLEDPYASMKNALKLLAVFRVFRGNDWVGWKGM